MFRRTDNVRTAGVSLPALAIGAAASVSVTWSPAFPDADYRVEATTYDPSGAVASADVTAKSATGCTVVVRAGTLVALVAGVASVDLVATHN